MNRERVQQTGPNPLTPVQVRDPRFLGSVPIPGFQSQELDPFLGARCQPLPACLTISLAQLLTQWNALNLPS